MRPRPLFQSYFNSTKTDIYSYFNSTNTNATIIYLIFLHSDKNHNFVIKRNVSIAGLTSEFVLSIFKISFDFPDELINPYYLNDFPDSIFVSPF